MNLSSYKTPGEIVAEILMSRQGFAGSFLLVEGDEDSRFFRARVHPKHCEIVIGGGKPAVVVGMKQLDARSFSGALGIVDADFDHVEARSLGSRNLVRTDAHDLDALLVRSTALDRVLAEYGDAGRIKAFESRGTTVREALIARALPFGRLRWLSERQGLAVPFDKLHCRRFVDGAKWTLDEEALLQTASTLVTGANAETLARDMAALPDADPWHVARGHDLVDLLALGLERALGNHKAGRERVAALLRQCIDTAELHATGLAQSIRAWEARNAPFVVLPPS